MRIELNAKILTTLLFSFLLTEFLYAQELPPIENFTALDYEAGNQNWSISQADDKLIYVANNNGLLQYNGARWTLFPLENETILRSVNVIDGRIYTGSYMDFGYWVKDSRGLLNYTSISERLSIDLVEDEEFWNIHQVNEFLVFQSLKRIYIYQLGSELVDIIESENVIIGSYEVSNNVFFQKLNEGVFKIAGGKETLILDHPIVRKDEVIDIYQQGTSLLFVTKNNGFWIYDGESFNRWGRLNGALNDISVYSSFRLENGSFALGTISHGLIYYSPDDDKVYSFNQNNDLQNNTVLSVFEDQDHNLWVGLDNGISYINLNSPIKVYIDKIGDLGSVYCSEIHNDMLYLGTNQGLYCKFIWDNSDFQFVEGTQGQAWSLKVIDGDLFCGHHQGTFIIEGKEAFQVSNIQGTWGLDQIEDDKILQGNYNGLSILTRKDGKWELSGRVEGFENSARYFEYLEDKIYVNHEYRGVFILEVDDNLARVTSSRMDTLIQGANSSIAKYQDDILYSSVEGIFRYDKNSEEFTKDSVMSSFIAEDEYITGRMVTEKDNKGFWVFTRENMIHINAGDMMNKPRAQYVPLTYDVRREVIDYENILNLNGLDEYIVGTSTGFVTVNINDITIDDFEIYFENVSGGINPDHSSSEDYIEVSSKRVFKSEENNFRIRYYSPEYKHYFKPTYQYQLIGLYDEWSEWSETAEVSFENLPFGKYQFNVRAKVANKLSSNIASYSFVISRPWYISSIMIFGYIIGIVLFVGFLHSAYRSYYKKQRQKLIENNKRSLELANLQKEKEIIKIRNQKLKEDYKVKSKELAASTMSFVKQNELLNSIKDQLLKVENGDEVKPVIKIIDKNLGHSENWDMFREAFDNADSEFFRKLQDKHPDLSHNELKLCAYLRLNLSSKEIGPLFNISTRSVEVKRYRLRKKMNLDLNENLTNYILHI